MIGFKGRALAVAMLLFTMACTERDMLGGADEVEARDDADDPGDQPEGEGVMFASCTDLSQCDPLEFCVFPSGEAGFCSDACAGVDDNAPCDVLPDGMSEATCLDIGVPDGRRVCAIDCEGGRECPRGMRCEEVELGGEARRICF